MSLKESLFKILGVVILVGSLIAGWIGIDLQSFKSQSLRVAQPDMIYTVEPGAGLRKIAEDLTRMGVIDHPNYFVFWGRWLDYAGRMQTGEYALEPTLTPVQLMERMVKGEVVQHSLTVVEGWTFRQLLQAVLNQKGIKPTLSGLSPAEVMAHLGKAGEHPEGRFFPDTYLFPGNTTDVDFLKRAMKLMDERLAKEWGSRDPGVPYKSPYEALIMASIVERETGVGHERPDIAGVFVRRLKQGMRLQTDPTVIYGMGDLFDGNLRRQDLLTDTPYNTYTRAGLPPTPIAIPSGDAIHAALHPATSTSLYFVAKGDGSHYFSSSLQEHNAAVQRFVLNKK
ncbi:MAG: endolytic transglycosylase MltG [Gammaproteobacteria bacterium]|nr:endolytic transglycosylase MltG [Gammaproteobacteria bacterium]